VNVGAKFAFEDLVGSQKDEAAQLELEDVRRCQKMSEASLENGDFP